MNGVEEKKPAETNHFLFDTNNEILTATPRRGVVIKEPQQELFIQHSTPIKGSEHLFSVSVEEKLSREFRIQAALEENESIEPKNATISKPLADAAYMFSTTFSCIMMLAAGHTNIPKDYLNWTIKCLENITDDSGNCLPNIKNVLEIVKTNTENIATSNEENVATPNEEVEIQEE